MRGSGQERGIDKPISRVPEKRRSGFVVLASIKASMAYIQIAISEQGVTTLLAYMRF